MSTGIYRLDPIGQQVEVEKKQIDYWCSQCQFPLEKGGCKDLELIQACWNETGSVAGVWHIQHECPFLHIGQKCQCNNFKNIKQAFQKCSLPYK